MEFGINISTAYITQHPPASIITTLKKLGATWVRLECNWYEDHDVQELVVLCKKHQISVLGLLTGLVPGTIRSIFFDKKKYPNPYDQLPSYLQFVKKTVQSYPQIQHWEIWNEPNLYRFWRRKPNPEEFLEVVKQTSKLIKSLQPEATIIMGSLCGTHTHGIGGSKKKFLEPIREIDSYVDIYGIHPYTMYSYIPLFLPTKQVVKEVTTHIKEFQEEFSNRPTWVTEYGISSKYFFFHAKKIKKIYTELISYSKKKNMPFFLWHLLDTNHNRYSIFNPETKFGIFTKSLQLKKRFK